ncbi:MAG: YdeI/OmpD-associated family protein [Candidatus Micrarchaeota archaeon]
MGKTIYITKREDWRSWLKKNYNREKEIWLIYYKKTSGKPRIDYNDAVEEALCYGWIDSIVKRVDDERFAQRFTPRRTGSPISEMNKERVRRLIKKRLMTKIGLGAISFDRREKFTISPDILKALQSNELIWKNFQRFSLGYKRVRIGYIEHARDHSKKMFNSRLNNFIKKTAKNKKFGHIK